MNNIEIYVDGSAINNENPNVQSLGGVGVCVRHWYKHDPTHDRVEGYSETVRKDATTPVLDLGKITNNTTELAAIYLALEYVIENYDSIRKLYGDNTAFKIYGDSQYAGNLVFGSWKPKQNKQLVAKVKDLAKRVDFVTWEYVKAHDGNVYNEYADYLAKSGAYNQTPLPFEEWKTTEF